MDNFQWVFFIFLRRQVAWIDFEWRRIRRIRERRKNPCWFFPIFAGPRRIYFIYLTQQTEGFPLGPFVLARRGEERRRFLSIPNSMIEGFLYRGTKTHHHHILLLFLFHPRKPAWWDMHTKLYRISIDSISIKIKI